jgi:ABC transport system ATP-binding/permease protein
VFEGNGVVRDFPGNYTQYREWEKEESRSTKELPATSAVNNAAAAPAPTETNKQRKLSYKEKRELEQLEQEIAKLEAEKQTIDQQLSSGSLPYEQLEPLTRRVGEVIQLLDEKGMRWLELSELEG